MIIPIVLIIALYLSEQGISFSSVFIEMVFNTSKMFHAAQRFFS